MTISLLYESHITVPREFEKQAAEIATELHWKTSHITDDPILGPGPNFYLTTHSDNMPEMNARLRRAVMTLQEAKVFVVREKIELILYDHRYPTPEPIKEQKA